MSRVLAGPWATQLLADLGAEVIKIEKPQVGDDTRGWGPPFLKDSAGKDTKESAYFLSANRNKYSVTVDFTTKRGSELIQELARGADVFIENFKVDGLKKYGLDYQTLSTFNPRLVYCSITGFGQTGPRRNEPGYDFIIQGMGGLMSITGEVNGPPMKVGVAVVDVMTGLYASNAITAALYSRSSTNKGQYIDISLLDSSVAMLANQGLNYLISGSPPPRLGNQHPNIAPYSTIQTSDGFIILAVGNNEQFKAVCDVIERPDMKTHPHYASNSLRVQYRDELYKELDKAFSTRPRRQWISLLNERKVSVSEINNIHEVFQDPQVQHREMKVELQNHPLNPSVPMLGSPMKLSGTPVGYDKAPPLLGQHTRQILREKLTLSDEALDQLEKDAVI